MSVRGQMMIQPRETSLPASVTSAGAARAFVADALDEMGSGEHAYVATLLVSELVTNAVLHAGGHIVVRVSPNGDAVRVEVEDVSARVPVPRNFSTEATTGRGLLLVDALAADWGADVAGGGKTVWFELAGER